MLKLMFTLPQFYLRKSAILKCIQIPQLVKLMGVVINFILRCNHCNKNSVWVRCPESVDAHGCRAKGWFILCTKFTFTGAFLSTIFCARLNRPVNVLQLCSWQFSDKETLSQTFFERSRLLYNNRPFCVFDLPFWGLKASYDGHLRLIGNRVVDFLLVIIGLFP